MKPNPQSSLARRSFTANLIDNGRLVPAGIVALNRAHERGYTIT
jgi:intracellular sulfur oxidation DsrE/DsrF family protein